MEIPIAYRVLPALLAIPALILDCLGGHAVPASLPAADVLFLAAVLLQPYAPSRTNGVKPFVAAVLVASACLARSILDAAGHGLPVDSSAFMAVASSLLLALCTTWDVAQLSVRRRDAVHVRADRLAVKVVCSVWLIFAGLLILAVSVSGGGHSDAVPVALSVLVACLLVFLYGPSVIRKPASPKAQGPNDPGRPMDRQKREEVMFRKIEAYMQRERPFLDDSFDMERMAREMLTNKSMVSRVINESAGENFCRYVNRYRIRYAVSVMEKDQRVKISELALMCGFHSVVSFNMAFRLFMNDIPSEYMRTLKAKALQQE